MRRVRRRGIRGAHGGPVDFDEGSQHRTAPTTVVGVEPVVEEGPGDDGPTPSERVNLGDPVQGLARLPVRGRPGRTRARPGTPPGHVRRAAGRTLPAMVAGYAVRANPRRSASPGVISRCISCVVAFRHGGSTAFAKRFPPPTDSCILPESSIASVRRAVDFCAPPVPRQIVLACSNPGAAAGGIRPPQASSPQWSSSGRRTTSSFCTRMARACCVATRTRSLH